VSEIKIQELRSLSENALKSKLGELQLELSIEKRRVASTGVASKVIKTREIRRTIARINTLLNQRGAPK
jgi:large subunit ribosomal protein L29